MSVYSCHPYPLDLGSLGFVEGLAISSPSAGSPLCHYFGGIPYALPPIERYRFRVPRPLPMYHRYGTLANPGRFAGKTALCPQPPYRAPLDKTFWDEDCLQLNIWIPVGEKPRGGWPVFFYIHGGWLQFGTANVGADVGAKLVGETAFKAIIVAPSYRLNLFGFLASKELEAEAKVNGEPVGNMGFWDQRLALEWTHKHIHAFGGDPDMITVGGYSAGSHSTCQQLFYDLGKPREKAIIKRAIMWSNGPGVQAKFLPEHQLQFDELLAVLQIPESLSANGKLQRLRQVSPHRLVGVLEKLKYCEFRALSDGLFVDRGAAEKINDGTYAREIKSRGIRILNGECAEEWNVYGIWRTPGNTYQDVYRRLVADYPEKIVNRLMPMYFPEKKLPSEYKEWMDAFGRVYADMQVYALERGFADRLAAGGFTVGRDLLRYRIEWRAKCVDDVLPPEWGVTHSSDIAIWFWGHGMGKGLTKQEMKILEPWNRLFADFVNQKDVQWPVKGAKEFLVLRSDGKTEMAKDHLWDHGLKIWNAVTENNEVSKSRL